MRKTESSSKELRISHFNSTLRNELQNIADNIGIPLGSLVKVELRKVSDSYPPAMKTPKSKD